MCALNCEAKPWVDHFGLKKQCDKPFWRYSKEGADIEIVVSGIGSLAMATAVGWAGAFFERPRVWLNLGIAGHADMMIGKICRVHSVINANDLRKHYPPLTAKWPGDSSAIATVNAPTNSYPQGAMIDMESHAFFQAASTFSPAELVQSIKVISDNQEQSFEHLNAAKITALMTPHVAIVNEFMQTLIGLLPQREIEHSWANLLTARCTHSQRQQLNALLKKASVLDLQNEVGALGLKPSTPINVLLERLQGMLAKSAPRIDRGNV